MGRLIAVVVVIGAIIYFFVLQPAANNPPPPSWNTIGGSTRSSNPARTNQALPQSQQETEEPATETPAIEGIPTAEPTPTFIPRAIPDSAKTAKVQLDVRGRGTYVVTVQLPPETAKLWLTDIDLAGKTISYQATAVILAGWPHEDIHYEKTGEDQLHIYVYSSPVIIAVDTRPPREEDFIIERSQLAAIMGGDDWFGSFKADRQLQIQIQTEARKQLLRAACSKPDSETGKLLSELTFESMKETILQDISDPAQGGWTEEEVTWHMSEGTLSCRDPQPDWEAPAP